MNVYLLRAFRASTRVNINIPYFVLADIKYLILYGDIAFEQSTASWTISDKLAAITFYFIYNLIIIIQYLYLPPHEAHIIFYYSPDGNFLSGGHCQLVSAQIQP
jgi:hypothetical protein